MLSEPGPPRPGSLTTPRRSDGGYRIRWSDSGHDTLFYPGVDDRSRRRHLELVARQARPRRGGCPQRRDPRPRARTGPSGCVPFSTLVRRCCGDHRPWARGAAELTMKRREPRRPSLVAVGDRRRGFAAGARGAWLHVGLSGSTRIPCRGRGCVGLRADRGWHRDAGDPRTWSVGARGWRCLAGAPQPMDPTTRAVHRRVGQTCRCRRTLQGGASTS